MNDYQKIIQNKKEQSEEDEKVFRKYIIPELKISHSSFKPETFDVKSRSVTVQFRNNQGYLVTFEIRIANKRITFNYLPLFESSIDSILSNRSLDNVKKQAGFIDWTRCRKSLKIIFKADEKSTNILKLMLMLILEIEM